MNLRNESAPEHQTRLGLGLIALLITIAGQLALYTTLNGLTLGLALSLIGLLVFFAAVVLPPPAFLVRGIARVPFSSSAFLIGAAIVLSLLTTALSIAFEQFGRQNYTPVIILWAASAVFYVAAFAVSRTWSWDWRAWFQQYRTELIALALVVLVAGILRFYQLGALPRVIDGDEGRLGNVSANIDQWRLVNPFALLENIGGIYFQVLALAINLFGTTSFALRLVPAIVGTLAIPATFLLGRRLFGVRVGLIAAAMLAVSHAHIHFSRIASVPYILGTFLIPVELYFFISGLQNKSRLRLAAAGVVLGLHFSLYVTAIVVTAVLCVYIVAVALLLRGEIWQGIKKVWVFWLGALIMALPEFVYAYRNPGEFMSRFSADGTFQSGWLTREMADTGQNVVQILGGRVAHAFLTLNYYPTGSFYGVPIPLLDFISSTLFLFGLLYALWRLRDYRYLLINGYFWGPFFALALFALPPNADSYRMLTVMPAVAILIGVGLDKILALSSQRAAPRWALVGVTVLLLLAVSWLNVRAYFVDFVAQCRFQDQSSRYAWYLGTYLKTVEHDSQVYVLSDDNYWYGTHDSTIYLAGVRQVVNYKEPVATLQLGRNSVVIATPDRINELLEWSQSNTSGQLQQFVDCQTPVLAAYRMP